MATAANSSTLAGALAEFRSARGRTLAAAGRLTQAQLDYAPRPGVWSAGEVLDHMLLAERANREQLTRLVALARSGRRPELNLSFADVNVSVAYLPRSVLPALELPLTLLNTFVPDGVRNYLTRNRLLPFRNPDQATPRRGRTSASLLEDLDASLGETESLFANNPGLDYGAMVVRHPLLGRYDAPGLLRFMAAHERRHQSQLEEIVCDPRFPRG